MTELPLTETCPAEDFTFTIRGTDTDCNDRLHLFALFSYMQEAAYHNAQTIRIGSDILDHRGLCWLLIRIAVRLEFLPHWGETITVRTWSRGTKKLVFLRDFEFFDQNGAKFGVATSEWLIATQGSHRPQLPETILPAGYQPPAARAVLPGPVPRPPRLPDLASCQPVLTQYADFSDIDRNRHVNNTRYIAWCLDTVHAAARGRLGVSQPENGEGTPGTAAEPAAAEPDWPDFEIREIDIHYISEIRLGTKIHLFCRNSGTEQAPEYLVEACRTDDGSTVFRARIRTD